MSLAMLRLRKEPKNQLDAAVLNVLRHCYVRESQHVMRYRQHAERIHHPEFRRQLREIAGEEQKHVDALAMKIQSLGAALPEVVPVCVAGEQNLWLCLRTDLEEEERCGDELKEDSHLALGRSPEVARLLARIERDCGDHRLRLRAMLADSDPLSAGPP